MRKTRGEEGNPGSRMRERDGVTPGSKRGASAPCPLSPIGNEVGKWAPETLYREGGPRFLAAPAPPSARRQLGQEWCGWVGPHGPLPALVQTRHGVDFRIPPLPQPPPPPPPPPRDAGRSAKASDRKRIPRRARSVSPRPSARLRPAHVPPIPPPPRSAPRLPGAGLRRPS